jgi:hypothetical protein
LDLTKSESSTSHSTKVPSLVAMSHRPGCGGHGSVAVGQDVLDELVFLFQHHVADIMT